MININQIKKRFGKNIVLDGINLDIDEPGIYAILGPNGSGKTTLIKSILGMVIPDSGDISINGNQVKKQSEYRHKIDYLPQIANFPGNLTVKELLKMIKDLRNSSIDDTTLINYFGINKFIDKKLSDLSGGMKQKVNIVLCFMFDSPLIILDEPTTGLDPLALIQLKDLIFKEKEKKKTILITSHIMNFVEEVSDHIVFLLEGKVYFSGSIDNLKTQTNEETFERAIANLLIKNNA